MTRLDSQTARLAFIHSFVCRSIMMIPSRHRMQCKWIRSCVPVLLVFLLAHAIDASTPPSHQADLSGAAPPGLKHLPFKPPLPHHDRYIASSHPQSHHHHHSHSLLSVAEAGFDSRDSSRSLDRALLHTESAHAFARWMEIELDAEAMSRADQSNEMHDIKEEESMRHMLKHAKFWTVLAPSNIALSNMSPPFAPGSSDSRRLLLRHLIPNQSIVLFSDKPSGADTTNQSEKLISVTTAEPRPGSMAHLCAHPKRSRCVSMVEEWRSNHSHAHTNNNDNDNDIGEGMRHFIVQLKDVSSRNILAGNGVLHIVERVITWPERQDEGEGQEEEAETAAGQANPARRKGGKSEWEAEQNAQRAKLKQESHPPTSKAGPDKQHRHSRHQRHHDEKHPHGGDDDTNPPGASTMLLVQRQENKQGSKIDVGQAQNSNTNRASQPSIDASHAPNTDSSVPAASGTGGKDSGIDASNSDPDPDPNAPPSDRSLSSPISPPQRWSLTPHTRNLLLTLIGAVVGSVLVLCLVAHAVRRVHPGVARVVDKVWDIICCCCTRGRRRGSGRVGMFDSIGDYDDDDDDLTEYAGMGGHGGYRRSSHRWRRSGSLAPLHGDGGSFITYQNLSSSNIKSEEFLTPPDGDGAEADHENNQQSPFQPLITQQQRQQQHPHPHPSQYPNGYHGHAAGRHHQQSYQSGGFHRPPDL